MEKYYEIIQSASLFKGVSPAEINAMLKCLGTVIKEIKKDNIVLLAGDKPKHVGLVLSGQLHIVREDYDGTRFLLAAVAPGEVFAEALCCAGVPESPVTVVADADSTVMLLNFQRILHTCPNACIYHTKLIENMLHMVADKNLRFQDRIEIVSMKSIRSKVTRYLESFIPEQGRNITIPFNREELADFLCVERSALSHELSRMKMDGLIDYRKNRFTLKEQLTDLP